MRRIGIVVALACLVCGTASAALDTSNVYTDVNGPWTGTTNMTTDTLSANIQWCVDSPVVHDGNVQFHYKYQITSLGNDPLSLLSVSMLTSNEAKEISWTSLEAGDVAPTDAFFHGNPNDFDSANWTFAGLVDGQVSDQLSYWSVNAPDPSIGWSQIQDSGLIAAGPLPSPSNLIPEPATLALLVVGGLGLLRRRRNR